MLIKEIWLDYACAAMYGERVERRRFQRAKRNLAAVQARSGRITGDYLNLRISTVS